MQHPVIYGRDIDDAPDYETLSEGNVINSDMYPTSIISDTASGLTYGRVFWAGKGGEEHPDELTFDSHCQCLKACIFKDGYYTKVDVEYDQMTSDGISTHIVGSMAYQEDDEKTPSETIWTLVLHNGEACFVTYEVD